MPATVVQDWVSVDTGDTASPTSATVDLGVAATAGNTLLVAVNADFTVSAPSGYTQLASSVHNAGCYLFGKIAAGGETGVTVTPDSAVSMGVAIAEIGGLSGATITDQLDQVATGGSSSGATTRSTGTTGTTAQDDEYAVAVWGYSAGQGTYAGGGGDKWSGQTNGFVEKLDVGSTKLTGTNAGLCVAAANLSAAGTVESTASTGAVSTPAESMVATFKVAAGGGQSVTPTGVAVPVALGTPSLADGSMTLSPDGVAVPVALGAPALVWSGSVSPNGLAVPVGLGAPTVLGEGQTLLHPTSELVAIAWLRQVLTTDVGVDLPEDSTTWGTGFTQVRAVGGTPHIHLPQRQPVISVDCWASAANGSHRPPWNRATQLAEQIRAATEASDANRQVVIGGNYHNAHVQAVYPVSEPKPIPSDVAGYAHVSLDLCLFWVESVN